MDKTAQRRGVGAKIREGLSPGRVLSKFFDPQFREVWDALVLRDDTIRSILSGEKVGKTIMPGVSIDKDSAKSVLAKAKSYLNQREFISAVSTLSVFHKKMQDVINVIKSLDANLSKVHHEFLFGRRIPDKRYMERLDEFEKRIAAQQAEFIKRAGLIDSLKNLFTERGRALKAWEKRYEDRVRPIRDGVTRLLESSQDLYNNVLEHLKTMASLRAARRVDAYVDEARKIQQAFTQYDTGKNGFREFYNLTIKPFMEEQRKREAEDAARAAAAAAPAKPPPLPSPAPISMPASVISVPPSDRPPSGGTPIPPPGNIPIDLVPKEEIGEKSDRVGQEAIDLMKKMEQARVEREATPPSPKPEGTKESNVNFVASLESLSKEDPKILASYISKYARSIQTDNPKVALQLFQVAKSLRG